MFFDWSTLFTSIFWSDGGSLSLFRTLIPPCPGNIQLRNLARALVWKSVGRLPIEWEYLNYSFAFFRIGLQREWLLNNKMIMIGEGVSEFWKKIGIKSVADGCSPLHFDYLRMPWSGIFVEIWKLSSRSTVPYPSLSWYPRAAWGCPCAGWAAPSPRVRSTDPRLTRRDHRPRRPSASPLSRVRFVVRFRVPDPLHARACDYVICVWNRNGMLKEVFSFRVHYEERGYVVKSRRLSILHRLESISSFLAFRHWQRNEMVESRAGRMKSALLHSSPLATPTVGSSLFFWAMWVKAERNKREEPGWA